MAFALDPALLLTGALAGGLSTWFTRAKVLTERARTRQLGIGGGIGLAVGLAVSVLQGLI